MCAKKLSMRRYKFPTLLDHNTEADVMVHSWSVAYEVTHIQKKKVNLVPDMIPLYNPCVEHFKTYINKYTIKLLYYIN